MKVALLNEKIQIQKAVVTTDAIGNRKNTWEDYFSCYATISGESGSEANAAGMTVEDVDITFTVRWCKSVSLVHSARYRIIFHDEIYNICVVDHMNYKKKSIKMKCQKVRR